MLKNEMNLLKELAFVRFGGTKEEYRAARIIIDELAQANIKAVREPFKVKVTSFKEVSFKTVSPYEKDINCKAYFSCGNCDHLQAPLYYYQGNDPVSCHDVKGKIVLVDGYLGYWLYKDLYDNGASGIIVHNGDLFDDNHDIDQRELRDDLQKIGILPIVQIHTKDAYKLLQDNINTVEMTVEGQNAVAESGNVVFDIPGQSNQIIIFTAHYDSTWLSQGVYDNATGTVGIMKIAEFFKEHQPYYTLKFVLCGSEERGLLGSKAYVAQHQDELDKIVLNINLDMIGSTMGRFIACVSAEQALVDYLNYYACEKGVSLKAFQDVYSSDSTPFADQGVPALSFARNTNITPIHCRHDTILAISESQIQKDIAFIIGFAYRMAKAKVFPVKREIPDTVKEQLDYYLCRKRRPERR